MTHLNGKEVWQGDFFLSAPLFHSIAQAACRFAHYAHFPTPSQLTEGLPPLRSGSGAPLRFVPQPGGRHKVTGIAGLYEMRGFLLGEVLTKPGSWHDFFHAMVWASFPRSKAALSWRAFWEWDGAHPFPWFRPGPRRSRGQDALTLFDEGGICVVYDDPSLWALVQQHNWQELWVTQRDCHNRNICYFAFGHALFEEALKGHRTIHASGVGLLAPSEFFRASPYEKKQWVDQALEAYIRNKNGLKTPADLHALPIWGIPGWSVQSQSVHYRLNTRYFR